MQVSQAQQDMRFSYYGGAPGVLASALVWLMAASLSFWLPASKVIWAFFIGGMCIHPLALVLCKALGRSGQHLAANPLGKLALENTALLIFCLPLAYAASLVKLEWFFPAMLLIIGGRYLTFATLYGMRLYWALGALLAITAYILYKFDAAFAFGALTGGVIELSFAAISFFLSREKVQGGANLMSCANDG